MADNNDVFARSIPEIYTTYLVPLIFEACALILVEQTSVDSP